MRGGTAAEWTSENPTLAAREVGVETDTRKLKIGDGTTAWTSLAYSGSSTLAALTDVTITAAASGDILRHNGTAWVDVAGDTIFQPLDTDLTQIAGLTSAANKVPYATGSGAWALADFTAAGRALAGGADAGAQRTSLGLGNLAAATTINEYFCIAIGDETTAITTGLAKVTFRMPFALTVTAVRASLTTASSSGIPTFDINEGAGAGTSILSTKLTIDANELTSTTAATAAVISDTALADDAQITIDVDVAGTGAAGAKIWIFGTRTV